MTTKEIGEAMGKPDQTVRNWIRSLASKSDVVKSKLDASSPAKPVDWTLFEVGEIIREGMGDGAAGAFKVNATYAEMERQAASQPAKASTKLPSGAQINAMHRLYGDQEARKRIDYCLGYTSTTPEVTAIAIAENIGRLSKQAYAVEMRNREQAENRDRINKLTPDLFK
jgi:hypothetical protein